MGIGLLNWFLHQEGEIDGFTKAMWTGQTTLQLAKTMEQAALTRAHDLSIPYRITPSASTSFADSSTNTSATVASRLILLKA